ncbi:MAG: prepilin-type N-terminal cleavage/methylation domain-containing protein [Acidimicrobiales bacterium]
MRGERGFSLVETMVVIGVIAVLVALAYGVYNSATARAQDRAVMLNLRNGLTSARVLSTEDATYTTLSPAVLAEAEPSLDWVAGTSPSTNPTEISVVAFAPTPGGPIVGARLAAMSDAGDCYYISDDIGVAQTTYGIRVSTADGSCQADDTSNVDWNGWPGAS